MKIQDLGLFTLGCEKLAQTSGIMSTAALGIEDENERKEVAAHVRKIMDSTEEFIAYLQQKAKPYNDDFTSKD